MKNILLLLLLVATASFAQIKSKRGPVALTQSKDGGGVVCSAPFGEEMNLLKQEGNFVLVKANCGQGWTNVDQIEKVGRGAGDKALAFEDVDIIGWMDDPSAIFILDNTMEEADGVDLNRNFREMLTHTQDRERIEMKNGEN
jgi:hypothetical protein